MSEDDMCHHLKIKRASKDDAERVLQLIQELAEYERSPNEVSVGLEQFQRDGWDTSSPLFMSWLIYWKEKSIGFMLCYPSYSTWKGRTLYLEDLYIQPDYRGKGIGMECMKLLMSTALSLQCKRVHWQALDWNENALNFYKKIGAMEMREWIPIRMIETQMMEFTEKYGQRKEDV